MIKVKKMFHTVLDFFAMKSKILINSLFGKSPKMKVLSNGRTETKLGSKDLYRRELFVS